MKLHRFISDFDFQNTHIKIEDPRITHQLSKVLRAQAGDRVILSDSETKKEAEAEITEVKKSNLEVKINDLYENQNEPETDLTLYISMLKKDRFEWLLEKVTEIGVKKIVPIISERTVKTNFKRERLEKIILEAAEQSGRGVVPKLEEAIKFKDAIKDAKNNDLNLFYDTSAESAQSLGGRLRRGRADNTTEAMRSSDEGLHQGRIGAFIGPEGGWSREEAGTAREAGLTFTSLGKLTLRAETAGIVACYHILML